MEAKELGKYIVKVNEEAISEAVRIASEALNTFESVPAPEPELVSH
jgi:hypothetical protein